MDEEDLVSPVSDAVVADSLSAKTNDRHSEFASATKIGECSNCHAVLQGRHCHTCGQIANTWHRPAWALLADIFDGLFGLDGRIWRTVKPLVIYPGQLTYRYLSGEREPFIQPFRLFLLTSLLFFLVFELAINNQGQIGPPSRIDVIEDVSKTTSNTLNDSQKQVVGDDAGTISVDLETFICGMRLWLVPEDLNANCKQKLDSVTKDMDEPPEKLFTSTPNGGQMDIRFNQEARSPLKINQNSRRFLANNVETAIRNPQQYTRTLARWAPRLVFILAPVFGLLLAASLFWRKQLYIYDHMIVALHFHSFLFLLLAALILVGKITGMAVVAAVFVLWSNYYLFSLQRRVYKTGRLVTVIRTLALDISYLFVLIAALVLLLVLGVLFV